MNRSSDNKNTGKRSNLRSVNREEINGNGKRTYDHLSSEEKSAMVRKMWIDIIKDYSFIQDRSRDGFAQNEFNTPTTSGSQTYTSTSQNSSECGEMESSMSSINSPSAPDQIPYEIYRKTENEYRRFIQAVELTPSVVIVIDKNCRIKYVNPNFEEVSGYRINELRGKDFGVMISDLASEEEYNQVMSAIEHGTGWKGELVSRKKNNEWYIMKVDLAPVLDSDGCLIDFMLVGQDVTPMRETAIRLEEALVDKNILLSELHHRVKNNLAILSGMMQLQAFEETDEYLKAKLFSSVGRVKTMASMHEVLYEASSFSRLEFGRNIQRIVKAIEETYLRPELHVEVTYEMEPVLLNINQAHPCSLIVNEVITNSYRHAFSGRSVGKVSIRMRSRANRVFIELCDNGDGLEPEFNIKNGRMTLGYQLLRTLVRQLNGTFRYSNNDNGACFTLEFERENVKGTANARLI